MCYNNCEFFRFNPLEGTDKCVKGSNKCPNEELLTTCCGVSAPDHAELDLCPRCLEHCDVE